MQLPRGTFREIQKNQKAHEILVELERSRFSGICSISRTDGICTLVFNAGKCILAEYNTARGDAALESLLAAGAEEGVDAALSTMDETQIRLSLEFNKTETVVRDPRQPRAQEKTIPPPAQPVPPAPRVLAKKPGPAPAAGTPPPGSEVNRLMARSAEKTPRQPLARPGNPVTVPPSSLRAEKILVMKENVPPAKENGQGAFENDLDTLDTMNLDQMKSKIRDECKTMVKHLRLDHLMDKD
jgi:hypothetical protein